MSLRLRGGGCSFEFNNLQNEIKGGFTEDGPVWSCVTTGLNLEGKCTTSGCQAFNETNVLYEVGLGTHNIALVSDKATCPLCKNKLSDVKNMLYSKCFYQVEGKRVDGKS